MTPTAHSPGIAMLGIFHQYPGLLIGLVLWELAWKGLALWRAARNSHLFWYLAMLLINSAGLLPMIYLLWVRFAHQKKPQAPCV